MTTVYMHASDVEVEEPVATFVPLYFRGHSALDSVTIFIRRDQAITIADALEHAAAEIRRFAAPPVEAAE